MSDNVLFYVQHLLGIGHVVRSARIARALQRAGLNVTIAYGGAPVNGIDWDGASVVQLPAVSAGPDGFGTLVDETGAPATDDLKQQRTDRLLDLLNRTEPDILLLEAYPFARRIMRFELLPLLQAAKSLQSRPLIASSIRDILQEGRKPERLNETKELVEQYFDAVLVHGDEEFAPLTLSFPPADLIADKLHYTGWVGPEPALEPAQEQYDVIVSAGGGAVGLALFEAALGVRAETNFGSGKWLVLSGPNLSDQACQSLKRKLPSFVTLERFRADLPVLLKAARLSISQAGYNTVADILSAGCRSVLVPFAEGGETEQTRRAEQLQAQGRAVMVQGDSLSVSSLSSAVSQALNLPEPTPAGPMEGAEATASILRELRRKAGV